MVPLEDYQGDKRIAPRGAFEGTGDRMLLHNLVANPDLAKKYLKSLGDEVVEYGSGWDFAFRTRGSQGPWTPAESHTFGGWILNHVADAVIAAGTGIAATLGAGAAAETGPGALVAGAAAGGAASGALEAARQGIGHLAGVPDNLDVPQIAAATAGGALAEPLTAAGGAVLRGVGRAAGKVLTAGGKVLPELAATVADIKPLSVGGLPGTTRGAVLSEGAALTRGGRDALVDPNTAGKLLRAAVRKVNRVKFPEIMEADAMTSAAGVEFDLSRAINSIQRRTLKQVGTQSVSATKRIVTEAEYQAEQTARTRGARFDFTRPQGEAATQFDRGIESETGGLRGGPARSFRDVTTTRTTEVPIYARPTTMAGQVEAGSDPLIAKNAAEILERITGVTGFTGDWARTPGKVAVVVRRILQNEAEGAGSYEVKGPTDLWAGILKRSAAQTRRAIERGMEPIEPRFAGLMKTAYDKLDTLNFFKSALRVYDTTKAGDAAAARFVRGVYGENRIAGLAALNDLDRHFSHGRLGRLVDDAIEAIRRSQIGASIGQRGKGALLPHVTGGGRIKSAGALVGLSYLAGGPVGAVAAGVASSPKFILRAAGPVARAGAAAQSAAGALARVHLGGASRVITLGTVDAASVAAMREVVRREGGGAKPLVRQETGKRRRILIGS